jgi:radical SAM superfamily enzyme YgiQ (UPF0313 family)
MNPKVRNRKVCLINPNLMRPPIGPIGLDYLAQALAEAGYEPEVLDLALAPDPEEALRAYFRSSQPLAVGLSVRNTDDCYYPSSDFLLPVAAKVISWVRECSDAPIVAGGVGLSLVPEAAIDFLGLDLAIRGDGEHALPLLLAELAGDRRLEHVPNLVWRWEGRPVRNRALYPSLRRRGYSRGYIDNAAYFRLGGQGGIETKRGCPMGCDYCADPLAKGRRSRTRDPRLIADEVERLLEQGVDHLHLCDSEFNVPYGHAAAVLEEWVRRGLGGRLSWYGYLSPVPFSRELAALMIESGCRGANFGLDHLDDGMLARLGRHHRRADIEALAAACRAEGLNFMVDLLLGGPGETEASLKVAIEGARGLGAVRVGIAPGMRVYPGTRMAVRVRREGLKRNPNLNGPTTGGLLRPLFYVSSEVQPIVERLQHLIGRDERFFLGLPEEETEANYNYNDNQVLEEAIRGGMRGAYWDILRRVAERQKRAKTVPALL